MSLTDAQLAYLRSEVGAAISEDELDDAFTRLGSLTAVAAEVVNGKLAALESEAGSYTIPGVISESYDAPIRSLAARAARLAAALVKEQTDAAAALVMANDSDGISRVTRSDRGR